MRRAVVALLVTAVAVVLVARYETHPPVTLTERTIPPAPPPRTVPGQRTADGPAMTTPFSVIQVQATLTHGRLTGVKTISMSGDGPHTQGAQRAGRADPPRRGAEGRQRGHRRRHRRDVEQHDLDRLAARGDQEGAPRWLSAA